jgi:aminoglycoside phosphotransferase family enzyme/predicted kinase
MPDNHYDIDTTLVDALATPAAFDTAVGEVDRIETHISWLILAGDYVYKIKKPIVLDFLDFGDLDKRRHYCEEEIRLNRRWAPTLYIDVVPVTMTGGSPRFGGTGEPVEYAVRMHRFPQRMRLDKQLERGELDAADMRELAGNIAARHDEVPPAPAADKARLIRMTRQFIEDNFAALHGRLDEAVLSALAEWSRAELARCDEIIGQRYDAGRFRDCHGDLHLGNLVRLDTGIAAFDCIDFNRDLRSIDVICDIAFLTMDLVARGRNDLAYRFLNRYLECSGDYGGMSMHDLYLVYRCLVRAKVATIRADEEADASARDEDLAEARRYGDIARRYVAQRAPALVIMSGLSGSGKTFVADAIMAALPAVRVRSDIERKRLARLDETADSGSGVASGLYDPAASRRVYVRLRQLARGLLEAGQRVVLDAAFLSADERRAALQIAAKAGCPAIVVRVEAPRDVLETRLRERAAAGGDASEADLEVLEYQLRTEEPPGDAESPQLIRFVNSDNADVTRLVDDIRSRTE